VSALKASGESSACATRLKQLRTAAASTMCRMPAARLSSCIAGLRRGIGSSALCL
jgi:hypothetical protein